MMELKEKNIDPWDEWNFLQPHFCNGLSLAFGIAFILNLGDYIYFEKAKETLKNIGNQETKLFLEKCIILWALKTI